MGNSGMLSATSEYALRAMVKLAQLPKNQMISGQELSETGRIPANYLSKLMSTLRNAGFVEAVRGLNGGYRLARSAREIHVMDVVALFEGSLVEPKCLLGESHDCSDTDACSAHARFRKVRHAYINFLATTSIAAIAKDKPVSRKK